MFDGVSRGDAVPERDDLHAASARADLSRDAVSISESWERAGESISLDRHQGQTQPPPLRTSPVGSSEAGLSDTRQTAPNHAPMLCRTPLYLCHLSRLRARARSHLAGHGGNS